MLGKLRAGTALVLALTAGCGGSYAGRDPAVGGPGAAVGNAVAAGVIWAAAGGCKLQGCPYGTYCDQKSGFCETHKCSEGCPDGTVCNEGLDRCQAPGPGNMPNDRLPQDDKVRSPPLAH